MTDEDPMIIPLGSTFCLLVPWQFANNIAGQLDNLPHCNLFDHYVNPKDVQTHAQKMLYFVVSSLCILVVNLTTLSISLSTDHEMRYFQSRQLNYLFSSRQTSYCQRTPYQVPLSKPTFVVALVVLEREIFQFKGT